MSQSGTYGTGGGGAGAFQVIGTVFTTNDTWTKNDNTRWMTVFILNGGSGGGSGRRGTSTNAGGGSGGAAGSGLILTIPESFFGATEAVVVGSGGSGGTAQTVNDTNGNNGNQGGISSFAGISVDETLLLNLGVPLNGRGLGGINGSTDIPQAVSIVRNLLDGTLDGVQFSSTGEQSFINGGVGFTQDGFIGGGLNFFTPQGGGGGGGADSVTERSGGNGQSVRLASQAQQPIITFSSGGTGGLESGTIDGGTGVNGALNNFGTYLYYGSGGGGGGGQSGGPVAGNGGDGGFPGGGGGGGGGSLNGTNSGSGGDGANGVVMVLEYIYT